MNDESNEILRYKIICGCAFFLLVVSSAVACSAYQLHVWDLQWGDEVAEHVTRHGLSFFCEDPKK